MRTTDYSQSIGPNDDDKADDDDEPVLRTTSSVVSCSHATKVQLRRRQNQRPETISSECTKHLTNIVLVPSPLVCPVPHCLLKIDFEYLSISHFSLLCVRCSVPAFLLSQSSTIPVYILILSSSLYIVLVVTVSSEEIKISRILLMPIL